VAIATANMLEYYGAYGILRYGLPGGPLHDPCVIAYLLREFTVRTTHVRHHPYGIEVTQQSDICLQKRYAGCILVTS
jgi:inosine-uridine nucleoside N-ribohydrolase